MYGQKRELMLLITRLLRSDQVSPPSSVFAVTIHLHLCPTGKDLLPSRSAIQCYVEPSLTSCNREKLSSFADYFGQKPECRLAGL